MWYVLCSFSFIFFLTLYYTLLYTSFFLPFNFLYFLLPFSLSRCRREHISKLLYSCTCGSKKGNSRALKRKSCPIWELCLSTIMYVSSNLSACLKIRDAIGAAPVGPCVRPARRLLVHLCSVVTRCRIIISGLDYSLNSEWNDEHYVEAS